jgi:hypothetical protein
MAESFETFLRVWTDANIHTAHVDSKQLDLMVRLLSDELTEDATVRGFYGQVVEAAEPYGGVDGYVRHELESDL